MLFGCGWTAELPAKELPPRQEVTVLSPAYTRNLEVSASTRRLRVAQDTAGLEALAAELRVSKESLKSGTWLLTTFYECAVVVPEDDPAGDQTAMAFYEKWAADSPESITAQLCLAQAYVDYAWIARGSGWASTVTAEGQRLMDERLALAWKVLEKARGLPEKCPQWTVVAQSVALGQGWSHERYFAMVEEAIRREPTYGQTYNSACYWLLPRWYGEKGDFEKWIAKLADAHPEKDKHYALLVWQADAMNMPDEMVFANDRLDWERAKRGFTIWTQQDPESLPLRNEFIHLAMLANDRATTRAQFDVIGGKYWPSFWHKKPASFEQARQFAYANGENPLRSHSTSTRRPLDPRVGQWITIAAHSLGGFLVGTFCLILVWQRRRPLEGFLVLAISIVLAVLYGTAAAAVPSAVFVLYLWSKEPSDLPEKPPHLWGRTLLSVLLLMGFNVIVQIVATIFALMPGLAASDFHTASAQGLASQLMASGEGFLIIANAQWLTLLLLLVVCGRQPRSGWRDYFALHPTPLGRAALSIFISGIVILGSGFFMERMDDPRTKESLQLIANGIHSPVVFFLTIVILAPILEELVMRGYAFRGWLPKFGFAGTVLATSTIFALTHVQYGWTGLVHVFVLGWALGWLRGKTGSIYPCIALHLANNLLYVLSSGAAT
ncbi:MAG: CPBP family intramembrane glutamic endopeptidase [Chthoniobacterales bacterium]